MTGAIPFISFPLVLLQGTPFSDYSIPGLALAIVVGGSSLLAVATILTGREVGVLASALARLITMGFEVVEFVSRESRSASPRSSSSCGRKPKPDRWTPSRTLVPTRHSCSAALSTIVPG
jgi:hypothetical protein